MSSRLIVTLILILLVAVLFYLVFHGEFSAKKNKSSKTDSDKPNKPNKDGDIVESQLKDSSTLGTELGSSLANQKEQEQQLELESTKTKVAQKKTPSQKETFDHKGASSQKEVPSRKETLKQKEDKAQTIEKTEAVDSTPDPATTSISAENHKINENTSDQTQYPLLDETELQSMLDAADSSLEEELFEQVDLVEKSKVEKSAITQPTPSPSPKPESKPELESELKSEPVAKFQTKSTPDSVSKPEHTSTPEPENKIVEPKKQLTTYKPIRTAIKIQSLEDRQAKQVESSAESAPQSLTTTDSTETDMQPFEFVKQMDSVQLTLDLAQQYIDLGEYDSAKRLLQEVILGNGTAEQKSFAQSTLDGLY